MDLTRALAVAPGEVVAFVGGGGKTTAMFRLAAELVAAGQRVITTTTTRIFAAQVALAPAHLASTEATPEALSAALERTGHVLVTGPVDHEAGKSFGIEPGLLATLRAVAGNPVILIEADGSRMRPFKAPAEHEPVIPPETTLVVPVVGADVFGARLDEVRVHRPERVRALAGQAAGPVVTPALVAAVLAHPQGGLKGVPPQARVIALINKVEDEAALQAGRDTAQRLLAAPWQAGAGIGRVALGAVKTSEPVCEVWGRVAGVVLAAGRSTRMGQLKQVMPWGQGTLLGAVVRRLQACGVDEVVVVTGHDRAAVEASLDGLAEAGGVPVRAVFNPDYAAAEMARSLQVGLQALPPECAAALVALGDQPRLDPAVGRQVVQRWRHTQAPVVAPFYAGQRGHPLLFDRSVWARLMALPEGANPRDALGPGEWVERVPVASDTVLRDVDTPEDYAREAAAGWE